MAVYEDIANNAVQRIIFRVNALGVITGFHAVDAITVKGSILFTLEWPLQTYVSDDAARADARARLTAAFQQYKDARVHIRNEGF